MGFLRTPSIPILFFKNLTVFLLFATVYASDAAVDSEKLALLQFKSSLSDPSGALSSWNSASSNHCFWYGVFCDSNSRVLALNITGSGGGNSDAFPCETFSRFPLYGFGIRRNCGGSRVNLGGKLSPSIAKLTEIRIISLPFNSLSGEIPTEIWGLKRLEVLDLEGNFITGTLPMKFEGLRNLRVLNLGFNKITGEIPSSILNCAGLQILNLAGNRLNGTVPTWICKFSELRGLYLPFNQFSGSIPNELGDNCKKLEHLDLSGNFLTDGIPSNLGNCTQLRSLMLYYNLLDEAIPAELGQLQKLEVLDLSKNSLSGPIPPELGNCSELSILVLSNLFDPIDDSKGDSSFVSMRGEECTECNYFQGGFPVEITTLSKLKIIWAPRATLEGNFPVDWGVCESLVMVNLAQNFFTGEISDGLGKCKNLQFLDLSSNRLEGELIQGLPVPCMNVFNVSGNYFSGSVPRFNYSSCPLIPFLKGYLPDDPSSTYLSFFIYKTQEEIRLPSFGHGGGLGIFHNFSSNNLTGSLTSLPIAPDIIRKQKIVYAFLAGQNKFTGSLPMNIFENCDNMNALIIDVSKNSLTGQIPTEIDEVCRSLVLLDASDNQITGSIPASFGNLVSLISLNLSWNPLEGQIPESLGQIKSLKYLSLAGDNLTGYIPSSLGSLISLESLELFSNSLSGEIPKEFVNLKNLTILLLNNNKLSGQIPSGLANVTSISAFNVSYNNLSGPLPSNDNLMKCSSLIGNHFLQACPLFSLAVPSSDSQSQDGNSQNYATDTPSSPPSENGNHGFNSIEIASITSASAIVAVLLALIILFIYTRKWNPKSRVSGSPRREVNLFSEIGCPLNYENVVRATGGFNPSNCIGNGGFGATYKAEIAPGVLVAIKRLAVGRFQGVQQFHAEIKTLGRLRHPNLVTLLGYHASETEMFLVYNYLPGGNLEKFIQERSKRAVDWRILHKIALDIARALAYLHDQCIPRVLHRDVKPSNILLDDDFNAYLSDFGLARLLGTSETHATTGVAGTFGYVAPEYAMTCRVSDKADVYSYGVVLLELMSDKKALDPSFSSYGNGFNIVNWACMLLRQGRAKEFFTAGLWEAGPHDDLVEILHLAVVCTVDSLSTRPTMRQVVRRLKQLQPPSC